MEDINFWHQVPLKDGRITPGKIPIYKLEKDYLFDQIDFRDKTVLDVGCWDGYFSFMAEQRGAKQVMALDDPKFRWGGMAGFEFLKDHFNSSVEFRKGTVFDLPAITFDVVLCYGVLYHLTDPLAAATNCFQASKDIVVFEGLIFEDENPILKLLDKPLDGDGSNVYRMSTGYLKAVGELNGFKLLHRKQPFEHRGTMLFESEDFQAPHYPSHCYPVKPSYLGAKK
jgi:tRNA (mo5U34)-methyltransferase